MVAALPSLSHTPTSHAHTYTYPHTHTYPHIYTHTYMHIHAHTYSHTHAHTYTYPHTHTHTYPHTHTYTNMHINTHTYTHNSLFPFNAYTHVHVPPCADSCTLACVFHPAAHAPLHSSISIFLLSPFLPSPPPPL
ncbi:hypothetical protein EMCRGX_G031337, partial [Ephydatia muelleri]